MKLNLSILSAFFAVAFVASATLSTNLVNTGTSANSGTGDPARSAFQKINTNLFGLDSRLDRVPSLPLLKGTSEPVRLMVDHDLNDIGDHHGMKHMFALADMGLIQIIAVGNEYTNEFATATLETYLNYYGFGHVPIGTATNMFYNPGNNVWHQCATNDANPYKPQSLWNSNYPSATVVYRRALAESPNASVVLEIEGSLRNLKNLWDSPADSISSLNGSNLCELKIKYLLISAGRLAGVTDYEYNIDVDQGAAAVINNLTVPVVWNFIAQTNVSESNFFVGQNSSNALFHPPDSPLYQMGTNYAQFGYCHRPAWDAYSLTYIASARAIADGTNWIDGTPKFGLSGVGRANYLGGSNLGWSNSIPGKATNQYYFWQAGIRTDITNFVNAFIDAPPIRGGSDKRRFETLGNLSAKTNSFVRTGAGTVSSVAYGLTNGQNSGMYFPGPTSVGIVAAGVESMRFFSDDSYFSSGGALYWASGAFGSAADAGVDRGGAGVVRLNRGGGGADGGALDAGVVIMRTRTNPDLPPVSGVAFWSSNAFLYSIHNLAGVLTTNLIKAP